MDSWKLQPIEKGHLKSLRAIQRSIEIGNWKVYEWPPEGMIQYYGQAIRAEDGFWNCWTPISTYIYIDIDRDRDRDMLNSII
jgi:hypothetical protein